MRGQRVFATVRSEGGLLPLELLRLVAEAGRNLPGLEPEAYHLLPGEKLNEAINRSWNRLQGAWESFRESEARLPEEEAATALTRDRWLLPLFDQLGYGRLGAVEDLPTSHGWHRSPLHLMGFRVPLDRRTAGVAGAARQSPHGLVQEFLNRSERHLWGFVSNGRVLRLLRDSVSLTRQSFVEFDLQAMFEGEAYPDFRLLWLLCHQSRVEAPEPADCWLERWKAEALDRGSRSLDRLREQVREALETLGTGFLAHPGNAELRRRLHSGELDGREWYRQILRLVYRLLFLRVAEERDLLLPEGDDAARQLYLQHYSLARLCGLAERHRGTRHGDLWQGLRVVMRGLGRGCPELSLPALGSFLWSPEAVADVEGLELSNRHLLEALRTLAYVQEGRVLQRVDYRSLGSEELGSLYESLLELHPEVHLEAARFALATAAGHERRTTGSYYTPRELVQSLLDSALEPVVKERVEAARRTCREDLRRRGVRAGTAEAEEAQREASAEAVLGVTVLDPASGSGHFLIAAAHRLARHLAAARSGEEEPPPGALRDALREVVGRCLYGVDANPMAVELCQVALWMEAMVPGRPLSFLEHRIMHGNSLLGATPALLAGGIPDEAFAALEGDDPKVASAFKKRNRSERKSGQGTLWYGEGGSAAGLADYGDFRREVRELDSVPDEDLVGLEAKAARWRALQTSPEFRRARLAADAWCAAFLWPKQVDCVPPVTWDVFERLQSSPESVSPGIRRQVEELAERFRFFHWHLAFPGVFEPLSAEQLSALVAARESAGDEPRPAEPGWGGGFAVVLGNPPWERIKIQEKEWFATRDSQVAAAGTAAERKRRIDALKVTRPEVHAAFMHDLRAAEGESHFLRVSGRYPLCGRGDINTYAVFAELADSVLHPEGRSGIIVPTGIATDDTTKHFFGSLVSEGRLRGLFSFENEDKLFPAVTNRMQFCLLVTSRISEVQAPADLVFSARRTAHLSDPARRFQLVPADFERLNPNTRTCPIFRSSVDADLNRAVYARVPVLVREGPPEENPWGVSFLRMLDLANDSGLFRNREELEREGWRLSGNRFWRGGATSLPLYEAKMLHQYDHRYGTYEGQTQAQANKGFLPHPTPEQYANPDWLPVPRYWVAEAEVETRLVGRAGTAGWLLGWRDICRSTDERTVIASLIPRVATGNTIPLMFSDAATTDVACLYADLCSYVLDYLARQKIGGSHLTYNYLRQLPVLPPSAYSAPWPEGGSVRDWLLPRVLELVYTAHDLEPFARDCGYEGPPFRWDEERRFRLRCELDAAFLHLYGLTRTEAEHVLESFPVVRKTEERVFGEFRTARTVLELYDRFAPAPAGVR